MDKIPTSAEKLAVEGLTTIVSILIGVSDQKKQKALEEYLDGLNIQQRKALEDKMKEKKNEVARQRVLFQAFAVKKNEALIKQTSKEFNSSLIIVGAASLILVSLIFISKRK